MQKRYQKLLELVAEAKPETIVEIGVWNGLRATQMAEVALKHNPSVHYEGYDLFEDATPENDVEEMNAKAHNTFDQVEKRLLDFQATHPGFSFGLTKGNTRETLPDLAPDFAFIDGGHSVETIRSDYEHLKGAKTVVFDDYYLPTAEGVCVDLEEFGANAIADQIPGVEIIDTGDAMTMDRGGIVALAAVRG